MPDGLTRNRLPILRTISWSFEEKYLTWFQHFRAARSAFCQRWRNFLGSWRCSETVSGRVGGSNPFPSWNFRASECHYRGESDIDCIFLFCGDIFIFFGFTFSLISSNSPRVVKGMPSWCHFCNVSIFQLFPTMKCTS